MKAPGIADKNDRFQLDSVSPHPLMPMCKRALKAKNPQPCTFTNAKSNIVFKSHWEV